jgi:hypothetical protein
MGRWKKRRKEDPEDDLFGSIGPGFGIYTG